MTEIVDGGPGSEAAAARTVQVDGPSDAIRANLRDVLAADTSRLGDVYRNMVVQGRSADETAAALGVDSSNFTWNQQQTISAALDGVLPTGSQARQRTRSQIRRLLQAAGLTEGSRAYLDNLVEQLTDADALSLDEEGDEDPDNDMAPEQGGRSPGRSGALIRAAMVILSQQTSPLPRRKVVELVAAELPPTVWEQSETKSGTLRYAHPLDFYSINLSKVGWLRKTHNGWLITDAGREALDQYPEPAEFLHEANRRYNAWRRDAKEKAARERGQERLVKTLARIPDGRWAAALDLASAVDADVDDIDRVVFSERPTGWFRVIDPDNPPASGDDEVLESAVAATASGEDDQRQLLTADGLLFDHDPPLDRRLSVAQLKALTSDEPPTRGAWLVRGSSVAGQNLVPTWLEDSFVSLPATTLPQFELPVERDEVAEVVGNAFANRAVDYRRRKIDDYDQFLRQMQPGDIVLTSAEGQVYAGQIVGAATWVTDEALPARVRREVTWQLEDGVSYSSLPDPLPERLSSQDDVTNLTADIAAIADWLDDYEPDDEREPEPATTAVKREAVLPDVTQEWADELHLDLGWLQRVTRLANRRKQVILYGPPGTGKTYLARKLAEHWTEPGNVALVQFHPSVTYEDFVSGYRPIKADDGSVAFELRPGPFMRLAELARDNPGVPHVLIIDEINRANLAKVFGELYFLLEYRNAPIEPLYSDEGATRFTLPPNVFIIGTMNTADRSIALVDAAMRRRFAFLELHPDTNPIDGLLRRWLAAHGHPEEAAELLDELNDRIPYRDFAIGPSYFMKNWIHEDEAGLEEVWETDLLPLLAEHHAGEDVDLLDRYGLATLRAEVAEHRKESAPEPIPVESVSQTGLEATVPAEAVQNDLSGSTDTSLAGDAAEPDRD